MDSAQLPALMAFVSVARHGSFTHAAAATGVTASALSQSIRSLETQLNVRLFNRTTRRVALTEAGAQFLARVRPALGELEAAFEALDETRDQPAGTLRINLPRIASELLVLPHLAEFMHRYPQIRLDMTLDDGLADVVGDGFDAGIRLGERVAQDMVAVPLSARFALWWPARRRISSAIRLRRRRPISPLTIACVIAFRRAAVFIDGSSRRPKTRRACSKSTRAARS